ncbi:MAG: hypothetical protein CSA22_09290 [Deltaproteobacteria bacterium]|nr:MAG: hypothetical protein CSA22_09290 [Deltaproteobacteria bacterium]
MENETPVETASAQPSEPNFTMGFYIKEGFNVVKSNPIPLILGNLVLLIMNSIAMGLLAGHWYAGMYHMVAKARRGESIDFGDAFWGFNNFIPNFVAGLVYTACIAIGSFLCVLPAFIAGGILLYVVPLVAFKGEPIGSAISKSKDEAMGSLVNHILFFFVASLIGSSGLILCGIGIFLTVPIGVAAMAVCYEERLG